MPWFASWWRNHQPKRAEKPHSKPSGREVLDGPATRPITPLAVENGVGKPAASERWRLMPAWEREPGALPSPICPCSTERLGRDLLFLEIVLVLVIEKIEDKETSDIEHPIENSRRSALRCMFDVQSTEKTPPIPFQGSDIV